MSAQVQSGMDRQHRRIRAVCAVSAGLIAICSPHLLIAKEPSPSPVTKSRSAGSTKKSPAQDDSVSHQPAKDLSLKADGQRKAEALAHFVQGKSYEEVGEMDKALDS